ncbi:MAG: hypothetical protein COA66_10270 [Arcobacter sp.]|nr:MAG: hypothetical protein COA66_10270 [Arcobacter sp.]
MSQNNTFIASNAKYGIFNINKKTKFFNELVLSLGNKELEYVLTMFRSDTINSWNFFTFSIMNDEYYIRYEAENKTNSFAFILPSYIVDEHFVLKE